MFMHDNNGHKEKEWYKCGGFYGFDDFMSFSFIWDEWVGVDIIGHWLNVRQGSCQTMGSQQNFCYGTKERKIGK
jgi:hypothetical protein